MKSVTRYLALGVFVLAVFSALGVFVPPVRGAGQSNREADEPYIDPARKAMALRALNRAFDTHVHVDVGPVAAIDIAKLKLARKRGMRGMILKNHWEPTVALAAMVRKEVPGLEVYGSIVLNPVQGGINVAAVEYMATQVGAWGREGWGRMVFMPTHRGVDVSRNGELLPEVKAVISVIAKYNMLLATGHVPPEEGLMLIREGRKQGARNIVVTHEGGMNLTQMQEAAKLGAFIEFDARDILVGDPHGPIEKNRLRVLDLMRKLGPQFSILHGFWTKRGPDRGMVGGEEYAELEGIADFVEVMHANGFTDRELDMMMKENPARLLNLSLMR